MLQDQTIPFEPQGTFPGKMTLAMAYIPYQCWEKPMAEADALEAGTVFPSLVKPFLMGRGGAANGEEAREVFGFNGKG